MSEKPTPESLRPLLYACKAVNMLNKRNSGELVAALLNQRDALADALRDGMMDLDHMLLAWPRSAQEWAHGARKMQAKFRALLAELEAKKP